MLDIQRYIDEAKTIKAVRAYMVRNYQDNLDDNGAINATALAEDAVWNSGLLDGDVLDDESHWVWDEALYVTEMMEIGNG